MTESMKAIVSYADRGDRIGRSMDRSRDEIVGVAMAWAHNSSPWLSRRLRLAVRVYERWCRIFDSHRSTRLAADESKRQLASGAP